MDEESPNGGMVVSHSPLPTAEPDPLVFAVPGWNMTGADEPSDAVGAVVWGVDPGGWTYSDDTQEAQS